MALAPLTYGAIKKNREVVERFIAQDLTSDQRIEAAIAFLRLGWPEASDEDFDALPPGGILAAAGALYQASYAPTPK
jgi:hypothetical protein